MLVLPPFGYTTALLALDGRASVVNTNAMALALLAIGAVSMAVYGHHLYATGLHRDDLSYYSYATYLIGIPTGVKYFTWLSACQGASGVSGPGGHGAVGFVTYFGGGGLTGVVLADARLDAPLHDTYYVAGHFHLVMGSALVYALAGLLLTEAPSLA